MSPETMSSGVLPYKKAKIYTGARNKKSLERRWYIYFFYTHPVTGAIHRFRYKGGINTFHLVSQRWAFAQELRDEINLRLKQGWSPYAELEDLVDEENKKQLVISKVIVYYFTHKPSIMEKSIRTRTTYRSGFKFLEQYLATHFSKSLTIQEVTQKMIIAALDFLQKKYKWGNRSRNNRLREWSILFSFLMKEDIIKKNPCSNIERLPETYSQINTPPTDAELESIVNFLYQNDKWMLLYASIIYFTAYRPNEIRGIKIEHIHFDFDPPFIVRPGKQGKEHNEKRQYIIKQLADIMHELHVMEFPKEFYLFSERLRPGMRMINRLSSGAGEKWRKLIKLQLGVNVDLYALKHKQAMQLAEAGATMHEIKDWIGHKSIGSTEVYLKRWMPASTPEFMNKMKLLPLNKTDK